jgi:hypothetical protein
MGHSVFRNVCADHYEAIGRVQGEAIGEAKTLLKLLKHRQVTLTSEQEQTIRSCADIGQLDQWVDNAFTAWGADDVFRPGGRLPNDFADRYEAIGRAKGMLRGIAGTLLGLLKSRGVELTSEQVELITSCSDLDQLKRWTGSAVSATSAADVFGS